MHWGSNAKERNERRQARPKRPTWPTLKRAVALNRPHLAMVFALIVVILVSSLIGLAPSLLLREIVDVALIEDQSSNKLNLFIFIMGASVGLSALLGVLQTYLSQAIGQGVMFDLRSKLYRHLMGMSLRWFTANRTGEVISRVNNDVTAVQGVVSDTLSGIVGNIVIVLVTFSLMLAWDWQLAIFCVMFLPLFIIPMRRVGNIQRDLTTETQEHQAVMTVQMQETLSVSGALLTKTFGRQKEEIAKFDETNKEIRKLNVRRALVGRWFGVGMSLFGSLAPVVVYWYGGHRYIGGETSVGTIVAFATLLQRMFGPVTVLFNINITIMSSLALFERLFDFLDLEQEIADRPGAIDLREPRGDVIFEHVTFGYTKDTPVLHDVSFAVPAGHFAALVGHSGAGKTTAAYLVPRLYDVDHGRVTVDGHDVRDISMESLAEAIGMVNQEPFLYHTTIAENLRYARPAATDDEVVAAAKAANIHGFISGLPHGYETMVGERGYRLSGGEKQRVAIARAILKDPAILILDEATSSLDSETERAIQDALDHLTRGRTVIAIAHRLSTILAADVIVVLEGGVVVESGKHAELLARNGTYARLYRQQFREDTPPGPQLEEAARVSPVL